MYVTCTCPSHVLVLRHAKPQDGITYDGARGAPNGDHNMEASGDKGIRGDGDARVLQVQGSDSVSGSSRPMHAANGSRRDGANDSGAGSSDHRDATSHKYENEDRAQKHRLAIEQKAQRSEGDDYDDDLVIEDDEEAEDLLDSDGEAKDKEIMLVDTCVYACITVYIYVEYAHMLACRCCVTHAYSRTCL
jgi:hypothetical protein